MQSNQTVAETPEEVRIRHNAEHIERVGKCNVLKIRFDAAVSDGFGYPIQGKVIWLTSLRYEVKIFANVTVWVSLMERQFSVTCFAFDLHGRIHSDNPSIGSTRRFDSLEECGYYIGKHLLNTRL